MVFRMRHFNLISISLALSLLSYQHCVYGLECYQCRSTSASDSCMSHPETESSCDKTYCTILRQELQDPAGSVTAFYRACEDTPTYLNTVVNTSTHVTYYRACISDLCNSGDGKVEVNIVEEREAVTDYILVTGVGSDAISVYPGTLASATLISIAYFLASWYE